MSPKKSQRSAMPKRRPAPPPPPALEPVIPAAECPQCSQLPHSTPATSGGGVCVCSYCSALLRILEDGELRRVTDDERATLEAGPKWYRLSEIMLVIQRLNREGAA